MDLLLYEWCCSGGLAGAAAPFAREGRLMLEALVADAVKQPGFDVGVLVESGLTMPLPSGVRRLTVPRHAEIEALVDAARRAAWTVIVAPESDGILSDRIRRVREAGGRVLAPRDEAIAIASDKQATIDALAARGVPVPAGCSLPVGRPSPLDFRLPAVRKARRGCGCEHLRLVHTAESPATTVPTRLEALVTGVPVGVSLLCGTAGVIPLPPLRQRFSYGDVPRYTGGEPLEPPALAERAAGLAVRAAAAISPEAGWLGIDMVLGDRGDGRDDRVLEINPRVTTSFVGQTRLFASSLIAAMIGAAAGGRPALVPATAGLSAASFHLPDE